MATPFAQAKPCTVQYIQAVLQVRTIQYPVRVRWTIIFYRYCMHVLSPAIINKEIDYKRLAESFQISKSCFKMFWLMTMVPTSTCSTLSLLFRDRTTCLFFDSSVAPVFPKPPQPAHHHANHAIHSIGSHSQPASQCVQPQVPALSFKSHHSSQCGYPWDYASGSPYRKPPGSS